MHDYMATELLHEVKEHTRLLRAILKTLYHLNPHNVTAGHIVRLGDTMIDITPGSKIQFTLTPAPSGATFVPAASIFTSDTAGVTVDSSDGLIADVSIADGVIAGTTFIITWTYTNADGNTATTSISETIVAPTIDVTGGTLERTV